MVDRPDLDEFLTALNGFLEKKPPSLKQDPSHLRFLEIFCRSVGSAEGHMLQYLDGKGLQSVIPFGLMSDFEKHFNETALQNREPSPLDSAYRDQQVVAVVELKRGSGVPLWFMDIMNKNRFKALIAVPLVGQSRAVGVLCAYYRDVCLFDQGTMDRLMTIGKMVGTAMEKSLEGSGPSGPDPNADVTDAYLELLSMRVTTKAHIFEALTKILAKNLTPSGIICGPLHMSGKELLLNVADGTGIPPNAMSHSYPVPTFIAQQLMLGQGGGKRRENVPIEEWGGFKPIVTGRMFSTISQPIIWQKQPQAALVAWRSEKKPFTPSDDALLNRLALITTLALRAI